MHPLHEYIAGQIADRLRERRVVVMYDKRDELRPFFNELAGKTAADGRLNPVKIGDRKAGLYVFDGSFLKARFAVEKDTGGDQVGETLIYIPGLERDAKGSLLMEVEKAGTHYLQPALKQFARLVLRRRYTDVAIDEMLRSDSLTYNDLARMAQDDSPGDGASLLKGVFGNFDTTSILTTWIADPHLDGDLESKGALAELRAVALARLGLTLPSDATPARLRAITARYLLANEFRSDLKGQSGNAAAGALKAVLAPATADQQKTIREVAKRLRERYGAAYVKAADDVENDLGLTPELVRGENLEAIDTFRFEEKAVVTSCFELIANEKFSEARAR